MYVELNEWEPCVYTSVFACDSVSYIITYCMIENKTHCVAGESASVLEIK